MTRVTRLSVACLVLASTVHAQPSARPVFAPRLPSLVQAWRAREASSLRSATSHRSSTPVERLYAAWFLFDLEKNAKRTFLSVYEREFHVDGLGWLYLDERDARAVVRAFGSKEAAVYPGATTEKIVELAENGDRQALRTFRNTWLHRTDGHRACLACEEFLPRLLTAQPRLLLETVAEGDADTRRVLECVVGEVDVEKLHAWEQDLNLLRLRGMARRARDNMLAAIAAYHGRAQQRACKVRADGTVICWGYGSDG